MSARRMLRDASQRPVRASGRRSDRRLASLVAEQIAAVIPNLVGEITQNSNSANTGSTTQFRCTFKHFNSCNPTKFTGEEGATGLLQWFESMESTFVNSECPDELRVRYATSVLQKGALTWWNGEKRNRGADVALSLSWVEVKELMIAKFCPRNEIRKLDDEFHELKQDSGENLAYNTRYHELSILVPHMVSPVSRAIEKYIEGLPDLIQDVVTGSKPTTVEEAIQLAASLIDKHVKKGNLVRKGTKKPAEKTPTPTTESSRVAVDNTGSNTKSRGRNYAIVAPVTQALIAQAPMAQAPPVKKVYSGNLPKCATCQYHHPSNFPCRHCTTFGRYSHVAATCRSVIRPQPINAQPVNPQPANPQPARQNPQPIAYGRACFNCGDPNHLRNQCLALVPTNRAANPVARGRAFNINAAEAQEANDVVNGTFLLDGHYASILFDTGADKSFVSLAFEPLLSHTRSRLGAPFTVEVADGKPISIDPSSGLYS